MKEFKNIYEQLLLGISLDNIIKDFVQNTEQPEINIIKYACYVVSKNYFHGNYLSDKFTSILYGAKNASFVESTKVLDAISSPFLNSQQDVSSEIENLDKKKNVFYIHKQVVVHEITNGQRKTLNTGTVIITTRFFLWIPTRFKIDLKGIFEILANKGSGLESLAGVVGGFLTGAARTYSAEKPFSETEKAHFIKSYSTNKKFIAIPLKDIEIIEYPLKGVKKRFQQPSIKITMNNNRQIELFKTKKMLEFSDELFEQLRLVSLLHKNVFIPSDFNNPKKHIPWEADVL